MATPWTPVTAACRAFVRKSQQTMSAFPLTLLILLFHLSSARLTAQKGSGSSLIIIAAPPTPLTPDGSSPNLSMIPAQASLLSKNHVDGVFVTGTTGESLSLTISERKEVLDAWIAAALPFDIMVIMHCGAESLLDARDLASYAEKVGAHSIGAMPPVFFSAGTAKVLVETMGAIASAAPSLPFYYYHIPSMTHVDVRMIDFLNEIESRGAIPTFAGIKYTDYDLYGFGECVEFMGGKYQMLYGHDEVMLAALQFGASGFVGSTYNFIGSFYREIIAAFQSGNSTGAWQLQSRSQALVTAMLKAEGATPGAKAALELFGVDAGPCRLPLVTLNAAEKTELKDAMKKLGFL